MGEEVELEEGAGADAETEFVPDDVEAGMLAVDAVALVVPLVDEAVELGEVVGGVGKEVSVEEGLGEPPVVEAVLAGLAVVGVEVDDVAVLDVHLNGRDVFDFADKLADADTPFVFATGYGMRGIPERFASRPVLQKPFLPDELRQALARVAPDRAA